MVFSPGVADLAKSVPVLTILPKHWNFEEKNEIETQKPGNLKLKVETLKPQVETLKPEL
ncbi:MAG: hypothetical protein FWH27_08475 [Planctomycetaceae bacterium]|nr:hypothetical protein [Planctomycetaceae bacterium]